MVFTSMELSDNRPEPLWPVFLILAACVVGLAVSAYLDANRRPGDVPPPIPLSVE